MSASASPAVVAGRRHHLAILFADLSDSTRISGAMEPELYAELLESLRSALDAAVARHGGQVVRVDGDGALCMFGWPEGQEDAVRRATEAAIDLHEATAALSIPVRMHSGVHAGLVLLREGDLARGRFELLGDATNVAARLGDAASAGEILVSDAALGADRHFFRTGRMRQVAVPGRTSEIAVVPVLGRQHSLTRIEARSRSGLTPFAGRSGELARFQEWLKRGNDGRSSVMMLTGPPGIGKTRLLGEFLTIASRQGASVHRGYCEAYLGARPLQPIEHLVISLGAERRREFRTGGAGGRPLAAELQSSLDQSLAKGDCLLAVDDWQWADDASRRVLSELVSSAPGVRFVLASRDPDPRFETRRPIERIEVEPLGQAECLATISTLLPVRDPFLSARIGEQSGGNPLYIEELCHASRRRGSRSPAIRSSAWLDMLIQARFSSLGEDEAAAVRAAAVIGHVVPFELFAAVSSAAPDDPLLQELARSDFLYAGEIAGTLRFKHGITRDAVYAVIALPERRALHRRVVEALDTKTREEGSPPNMDALAYHCAACGDLARAVPAAIAAGDAALAAGAVDRARAHFVSAFENLVLAAADDPDPVLVWRLVNKYGLACIADPSPDQLPVLAAMAERLEQLGHAEGHVRSRYWQGAIAYGLGEGRSSTAHLEAALSQARSLSLDRLSLQIEVKLAQSLFAAGAYARADALFERVLPSARGAAGRNDRETLCYALCCHGFLLADRGAFPAAEARYGEAARLLNGTGASLLASLLTQRSAVRLMQGRWREALEFAERCLQECGPNRARYQSVMARALAAYARWRGHGDARALEILIEAAGWFSGDASRQRTSLLYGWLAEVAEASGEAETALRYARETAMRVRTGGDRLGEGMAYRAMARVAAAGLARHGPARYLRAAQRSAAVRGSGREMAMTDLCEGWICLGGSGRARAATLARRAEARLEGMGAPVFLEEARALLRASR